MHRWEAVLNVGGGEWCPTDPRRRVFSTRAALPRPAWRAPRPGWLHAERKFWHKSARRQGAHCASWRRRLRLPAWL